MTYVNLLEAIYPIGSFYLTMNEDSPSDIVGGIWAQIDGAVLRGASIDGSSTLDYIGNDTCTLNINQIPSHNHVVDLPSNPGAGKITAAGYFTSGGGNTQWQNTFPVGSVRTSGGGAAHSIVQRSYNCHIWRRIA